MLNILDKIIQVIWFIEENTNKKRKSIWFNLPKFPTIEFKKIKKKKTFKIYLNDKIKNVKGKIFWIVIIKKKFFQFNVLETINIQKWFGNNPNFKSKPKVFKKKKSIHPKIKKIEPKHWKIKYFKEE